MKLEAACILFSWYCHQLISLAELSNETCHDFKLIPPYARTHGKGVLNISASKSVLPGSCKPEIVSAMTLSIPGIYEALIVKLNSSASDARCLNRSRQVLFLAVPLFTTAVVTWLSVWITTWWLAQFWRHTWAAMTTAVFSLVFIWWTVSLGTSLGQCT